MEYLNTFQVFIDALSESDYKFIISAQYPMFDENLIEDMIKFNARLTREAGVVWGFRGSPWEMNLRDLSRWCDAVLTKAREAGDSFYNPGNSVELIYADRMRTEEDRMKVLKMIQIFFCSYDQVVLCFFFLILSDCLGSRNLQRGVHGGKISLAIEAASCLFNGR